MPQLDPTWFASQLFWLAVSFTVLYFILSRLILPPLQEVIARREQTQGQDIETAQALKFQADHAKQEYEATMAASREKAQGLLAEAVATQKAKAEAAGREMDAQIAKKLDEASKKIAVKKQELTQSLVPTAVELAGMVVEKLTQQKPAQARIEALVAGLSKQHKG